MRRLNWPPAAGHGGAHRPRGHWTGASSSSSRLAGPWKPMIRSRLQNYLTMPTVYFSLDLPFPCNCSHTRVSYTSRMAGGRRTFASSRDMGRRRPWPGGAFSGGLDLDHPSRAILTAIAICGGGRRCSRPKREAEAEERERRDLAGPT